MPASSRRNETCPCGSGRKFKICCWALSQKLSRDPARGFSNLNDLPGITDLRDIQIFWDEALTRLLLLQRPLAEALFPILRAIDFRDTMDLIKSNPIDREWDFYA